MSSYYSICVLTGDQTFSVWSARLSYVPPSEWDLSYIKVSQQLVKHVSS